MPATEELTHEEEIALTRMQLASNLTADKFGVKRKFLEVMKRKSYAGKCFEDEIIIARSVLHENEAWQIFIAVHEICHDIASWENSHNGTFIRIEEAALKFRGITRTIRPRTHVQWVKYQGQWYSWNSVMKRKKIVERKRERW